MDVDFLNLTTEAQMDLMNMMMHMEKLSQYGHEQTPPPLPPAVYSSGPSPAFCTAPTGSHSPVLVVPPPTMPYNLGTRSQDNVLISSDNSATDLSFAVNCHNQASVAAMREMIYRIAAMQPIHIDPESVKPPKRRNVRISKDPQSVAARHRRERISERIRILQRLVPGGTKMDTASMLDEAILYVKFLKSQVQSLEQAAANRTMSSGLGFSSGAGLMINGHYLNHSYTNNVDLN